MPSDPVPSDPEAQTTLSPFSCFCQKLCPRQQYIPCPLYLQILRLTMSRVPGAADMPLAIRVPRMRLGDRYDVCGVIQSFHHPFIRKKVCSSRSVATKASGPWRLVLAHSIIRCSSHSSRLCILGADAGTQAGGGLEGQVWLLV